MTYPIRRTRAPQLIRSIGKPMTFVALLAAFVFAPPAMAQSSNEAPAPKVLNDKMTAIEIPA